MKPPSVRKASDRVTGGRVAVRTQGFSQNQVHALAIAAISAPPGLALDESIHVDEGVRDERLRSSLRHVAGKT